MTTDYARRVHFRPYMPGMGPTFTLTIYDDCVPCWDSVGRQFVRADLVMRTPGVRRAFQVSAEPFTLGLGVASDSDRAVRDIMAFLTIGVADDPACPESHREYAEKHAETLWCEVSARFGGDHE